MYTQQQDVFTPLTREQIDAIAKKEMARKGSHLNLHPEDYNPNFTAPVPLKGPRKDPNLPGELTFDKSFMEMTSATAPNTYVPKKGGATMPQSPAGARAGLSSLFGGDNFVPQGAISAMSTSPQSAEQNSAENAAVVESLMKQFTEPINPDILRAGLTPVPSGTTTGIVPPSLTRPVAPFQDRPFNTQRVVGAGNARARGIGNAITGVTNALGHVVAAKKQLDQDKLSVSMQRLLSSQQAINQAKQFLSDPNIAPDRKAALQASVDRNTKVMNTILEDKKVRGDIEKGLNISFTDPSKNKTDQHAGVQEGIKSFREQFEEQMPQTLGPDPMAQMRMEEAIRMQQMGQKMMQSVIPRIIGAKDAMDREMFRQHAEDMRKAGDHMYAAWALGQQFANQKELVGIRHTNRMDEIGYQIQQMGQKAMELFQNQKLDPVAMFDAEQKFYQGMGDIESKYNNAKAQTITSIATLSAALGKATNSDEKEALRTQIKQMQDFQANIDLQMKNLQEFKGRYSNVIKNLRKQSAGQAPDSGGQSGTGTGTGSTPITGAGGSFDPGTLLFGVPFSSGGALPPTDGSDDSTDDDSSTP